MSRGGNYATLTPTSGGDLALRSSYHPGLVADLKADVPASGRRWDPKAKVWLVDPRYAGTVRSIVRQHLGIRLAAKTSTAAPKPETRMIKVEYLGAAKDRGSGESVAYGYADGDWSVALPLSVLRKWFEMPDDARPDEAATLYSVIGVSQKANNEEIKKAYRRMARQWHPDVCSEPDAHEQFQRINHAYQVLSDGLMRRKYDAGLAFAKNAGQSTGQLDKSRYGWRPPLRCGWLLVEGVMRLGRFNVSKIVQWEDVTDSRGRVMVSSWPPGGDTFDVRWV